MQKEKKVSPEEMERRREDYKRFKENQLPTEVKVFHEKICKIRLNEFRGNPTDRETYTGEVVSIGNHGVLIDENDKPLFISWTSIRTINLSDLNIKPRLL